MTWPMIARLDWGRNPFNEMQQLHREVSRLFGDFTGRGEEYPALNVWSDSEEALVMAEIPGVDPRSLNITVTGDVLTLAGERKPEEVKQHETYHRREVSTGSFSRSIRLPFAVESDKVAARCENGLLRLTLPRKESTKPRRIAIAAE